MLNTGIDGHLNLALQGSALRFTRWVNAIAVDIKLPAVINAAEPLQVGYQIW